jgi:hypothetical protein
MQRATGREELETYSARLREPTSELHPSLAVVQRLAVRQLLCNANDIGYHSPVFLDVLCAQVQANGAATTLIFSFDPGIL